MTYRTLLLSISCLTLLLLPAAAMAQKACFTAEGRAQAERTAKVYRAPDPGYDPVLGFNPSDGPRKGSPPVDSWFLNLLDGATIRQIELNKVSDVKIDDAKLQEELSRAWMVLAMTAQKGGKVAPNVAEALVQLLDDPDRDVRVVATRAIAGLGSDTPKAATQLMTTRWRSSGTLSRPSTQRAQVNRLLLSDLTEIAPQSTSRQHAPSTVRSNQKLSFCHG